MLQHTDRTSKREEEENQCNEEAANLTQNLESTDH